MPKTRSKPESKCVCGGTITGKKFTVVENILGEKVIRHYHGNCFERMVLGIKNDE